MAPLRAAVFSLSSKNFRGGGYPPPPPAGARVNLFGTIRGWLVRYGLMCETVPELFSVKAHTKHQQLLTNVGVCSIRRNGFESESQLESESESELELNF